MFGSTTSRMRAMSLSLHSTPERRLRHCWLQLCGPSVSKTWSCSSGSRGGHKDDERAGTALVWGQAERVERREDSGETSERPFRAYRSPYREDGDSLSGNAVTGHGPTVSNWKRGHLDEKFFTVKGARHWNRLSREPVGVPSLELFMARLDKALSSLV